MTLPDRVQKIIENEERRESALEKLEELSTGLKRKQEEVLEIERLRKHYILDAYELGASQTEIANAALISRSRIKQLLNKLRKPKAKFVIPRSGKTLEELVEEVNANLSQ